MYCQHCGMDSNYDCLHTVIINKKLIKLCYDCKCETLELNEQLYLKVFNKVNELKELNKS